MNSFRITGPNFILSTPNGVAPSAGFRIGLNCVTIDFKNTPVLLETGIGTMQWNHPSIRIDNLLFDRKAGFNGEINVSDFSGLEFRGRVDMHGFKLSGVVMEGDCVVKRVNGDFINGVFDTVTNDLWIEPLKHEPIMRQTPKGMESDVNFSTNVWGKVFGYLRCDPPDFIRAEEEKIKVEEAQREKKESFESRFGFGLS